MRVHILTDDKVRKRGFLAEHGLSLFIEHPGGNILFDTGQSSVYSHNAALLGINLEKTDHIILSHGHYDHCGGLIHFPMMDKLPQIHAHPGAFARRYVKNPKDNSYRDAGIPWTLEDNEAIRNRVVFNQKNTQLIPKITLHGEIPSTTSFEGVPEGFYTGDKNNKTLDMIKDEQMLVIEQDKSLYVFLGCSHPGIINCLNYALKLFPNSKVDTLVAGMHLEMISPLRLQMTIESMLDLDIRRIIPLHCTGINAIYEMKKAFSDSCLPLYAGDTIDI